MKLKIKVNRSQNLEGPKEFQVAFLVQIWKSLFWLVVTYRAENLKMGVNFDISFEFVLEG